MTGSEAPESAPELVLLSPGDPASLTGGHRYNRQLVQSLSASGIQVQHRSIDGQFPFTDAMAAESLDQALQGIADLTPVVIDGLAFSALPEVVAKHSTRLPLLALIHLPLADETGLSDAEAAQLRQLETRALAHAAGVITTSPFCAQRMLDYAVPESRILSVPPGIDSITAPSLNPTSQHHNQTLQLLCVANLTPRKAQDTLLKALGKLVDLDWHCTLVGSPDHDPTYASQLRQLADQQGIAERLSWPGVLTPDTLHQYYQQTDVFVLPSRFETYGMVINEALCHGLPIISTDGGALGDTVPAAAGIQVAVDDVAGLAAAIRQVVTDPGLRQRLSANAREHARQLPDWSQTAMAFWQAVRTFCQQSDPVAVPGDQRDAFSADWLSSREQADHEARDADLTRQLADSLGDVDSPHLVDLGCGTGSNLRYLAPRLNGQQTWTLMDHDPALLRQATLLCQSIKSASRRPVAINTHRVDLKNLDNLVWSPTVDVITASALLDLVSACWLKELATEAARQQARVLVALTYNGEFSFSHPLPDDELVREAFNTHQESGDGLGPRAADVCTQTLQAVGYDVSRAISTWQLTPAFSTLKQGMILGWASAASEQVPAQSVRINAWREARLALINQDVIQVGHVDILALPSSNWT